MAASPRYARDHRPPANHANRFKAGETTKCTKHTKPALAAKRPKRRKDEVSSDPSPVSLSPVSCPLSPVSCPLSPVSCPPSPVPCPPSPVSCLLSWACLDKMDSDSGSFDMLFRCLFFERHR